MDAKKRERRARAAALFVFAVTFALASRSAAAEPAPVRPEKIMFQSDRFGTVNGYDKSCVMNTDGTETEETVESLEGTDGAPPGSPWAGKGYYRVLRFAEKRARQKAAPLEIPAQGMLELVRENGQPISLPSDSLGHWGAVWSSDGRRLVFAAALEGNNEVYLLDAHTRTLRNLSRSPADDHGPAFAPDGGLVAFTSKRDGDWEIYLSDGHTLVNLTRNPATDDMGAVWSPAGDRLIYQSVVENRRSLYLIGADGSDRALLTDRPADHGHFDWSLRGERIAFKTARDGIGDIWVADADGANKINLTQNRPGTNNAYFSWAPDGKRLVFDSNQGGQYDIYVAAVDGSGIVNLTDSPHKDHSPIWLFPLELVE